jgi:hypothetical protein
LNSLGFHQATFYKTFLAQWNIVFRKFECFPLPNPYVQCGKRPLPRLLEIFPDTKDQIVAFGVTNLATLTIEAVHDFTVSTVIPRLASLWQKDEEAGKEASVPDTNTSTTTSNIDNSPKAADNNHDTVNESFLRIDELHNSLALDALAGLSV